MDIKNLPTNWRDKYQQAQFRWAIFFVDTDQRGGGRRVALHEYPKRSIPYAEDMGRAAVKIQVTGYLIGRITKDPENEVKYLTLKDNLIECLEQDGPGLLRLPLPYKRQDMKVMVQAYSVTESRERGGMCAVEMQFVEYGNPTFRPTISTPAEAQAAAARMEAAIAELATLTGVDAATIRQQVAAYEQVRLSAQP